jgi:hypothetical protein
MYNPVNMKIEDQERLYERDLREKNKRKRFELRYDVEAMTRKQGIADQIRAEEQKMNKMSYLKYKEELERGFDILTNDPLTGPDAVKPINMPKVNHERTVWSKAL